MNTFVLILCASALIFLTLILSHHAHTAEAKELLHEITEKVTFDVLDGVHFLAILFTQDSLKFLFKNPSMENGIIWLTCFNFLLPTIALMKLFTKLSDTVEKARLHLLASLVKDFSSVLLNLLLVNVPYFVVRCYLWSDMSWEISVFMLKNGIMIVIQTRLVVIYIRRFIKYRRNTLNQ